MSPTVDAQAYDIFFLFLLSEIKQFLNLGMCVYVYTCVCGGALSLMKYLPHTSALLNHCAFAL